MLHGSRFEGLTFCFLIISRLKQIVKYGIDKRMARVVAIAEFCKYLRTMIGVDNSDTD